MVRNWAKEATKRTAMACKSKLFLVFLFLKLNLSLQISSQEKDPTECNYRQIYIRRLPPRFNLDLLTNCSEYPLFDDFCPYQANHGLGQKSHKRSHSWYPTDQSMLELVFHRLMLEYPCLTTDPNAADAVYLPYYAGIDALRYLYRPEVNSSADHGLDLFDFLQEDEPNLWKRSLGHDHFLVMARPAWDFSQPLQNDSPTWGTSFLELPELFNVTALTFEGRAWPWQENAISYPTSFHPPNLSLTESWIRRVRYSKRSTLMLFAGCRSFSSNPNIRRSIGLECENATAYDNISRSNITGAAENGGYSSGCEMVDCSNKICEHDPIRFMKPMLRSSFCLQPPGDTPTRRSTFEGILSGRIPVFFDELSARAQYRWHLAEDEYEEFSVTIGKENVVFKGLRIVDVLMEIPRERVEKMREKLLELIPRIIYRKHGSSLGMKTKKKAAFDIAIEAALRKIKGKVKELH